MVVADGGAVTVESGGAINYEAGGVLDIVAGATITVRDGGLIEAESGGVIELESGIPIYDAFKHVADNYPVMGKYLYNIVEDQRLNHVVEVITGVREEESSSLLRLFFQRLRTNSE